MKTIRYVSALVLAVIAWAAVLLVVFGVLLPMVGCGSARVGSLHEQDAARTTTHNAGPNAVNVVSGEQGETASSSGSGPSGYTLITENELRRLGTGHVPRDVVWRRGDQLFSLSSGTDIEAEGIDVDPETGRISIARFGTSASEPLRALEGLQRLATAYAAARDEESRRVIEAEARAIVAGIEATAPGVLGLLRAAVAGGQ